MVKEKPLIEYVAEYIVKRLKHEDTDSIVAWYVENCVFKNESVIARLAKYYGLPDKDLLEMHYALVAKIG